ncbi:MAG TPA: cupredoxin family protein [Rubrivivax sp.]|nr:cupredoxin family protein [Rubrivivax sp.]
MKLHALAAAAALAALLSAAPTAFAGGDGSHTHAAAGQTQAGIPGRPGDPKKVNRTVRVVMDDRMRFEPERISVQRGDTVRFVLVNQGRLAHEMVLGSVAEMQAHAEQMRKHPGMAHAEPNQVSVDPGQTGELVWQFTQAGDADFACLLPGHFEAGMRGQVKVVDAAGSHKH